MLYCVWQAFLRQDLARDLLNHVVKPEAVAAGRSVAAMAVSSYVISSKSLAHHSCRAA